MTTSMKLQVQRLEAELAAYRDAFGLLIATKVELAAAVEGQPTREQLIIEVTKLREAIMWLLEESAYSSKQRLINYLSEKV